MPWNCCFFRKKSNTARGQIGDLDWTWISTAGLDSEMCTDLAAWIDISDFYRRIRWVLCGIETAVKHTESWNQRFTHGYHPTIMLEVFVSNFLCPFVFLTDSSIFLSPLPLWAPPHPPNRRICIFSTIFVCGLIDTISKTEAHPFPLKSNEIFELD